MHQSRPGPSGVERRGQARPGVEAGGATAGPELAQSYSVLQSPDTLARAPGPPGASQCINISSEPFASLELHSKSLPTFYNWVCDVQSYIAATLG